MFFIDRTVRKARSFKEWIWTIEKLELNEKIANLSEI